MAAVAGLYGLGEDNRKYRLANTKCDLKEKQLNYGITVTTFTI